MQNAENVMNDRRNEKQIRFPVQIQADNESSIEYGCLSAFFRIGLKFSNQIFFQNFLQKWFFRIGLKFG